MGDLSSILSGPLVIAGLVYIFYFRPKFEKAHSDAAFDHRVLGFIDGLYLSGINFGCSASEMRHYVEHRLAEAHQLPGNQFLIEHVTSQGRIYYSHMGTHDHMLFALLCIAKYAKTRGNDDLLSWCETKMRAAEVAWSHY